MRDDTTQALELVLEEARTYLEQLPGAPVRPADIEAASQKLDGELPETGDGTLAAITRLIEGARDAHIRSAGPRFFHWVIGGSTPAALAGDWLASLLDQNAAAWDSSPLAFQVERTALAWLRDLFDLPAEWSGVLTTGATAANFTALAAARQWWGEQHGVDVAAAGLARPVPVLSSGFIHVSARKALAMLGIGRDTVRICADDATGRLDLAALERELRALGEPAIVIANAGEVNAGHFDPIAETADLAAEHGAWLHVDGAFGLFARLSPRTAALTAGVEHADSVIADGHKWLNVPFDCGFAFVRDRRLLNTAFGIAHSAAYLPDPDEDRLAPAELGPEMSRRARALPVWATLAAYGRSGHRELVERNLAHAQRLAERIRASSEFELLADVPVNIVCFRYRPTGLPEQALDELNERLGAELLADGRVYAGTTRWAGRVAFRPAFVNWRTTDDDVDLLLETLAELGGRIRASSVAEA
ncbi:MAG TPA: pyridoxal-dependent decarboxylase [Gaiellaceae bacterium]|nr:pyridoxal-dependent decarboxylase [Gaiellaceae bacterium]